MDMVFQNYIQTKYINIKKTPLCIIFGKNLIMSIIILVFLNILVKFNIFNINA